MFRRERPQKGRYRQFFQIGAEAIGSESPMVDAEVIEMVVEVLRQAGLSGFRLLINSVGHPPCRAAFAAELREKLKEVAPRMCGDCQRRAETNPLRVLDCKVPEDQPIIDSLPSILDHLCDECRVHFETVKEQLTARGIPFEIRSRLVRGLDYYTRTTFEIVHGALGAQNSVLGGGRYDGLAESLGSRVPAPGIGFSIGEDRLVMTVEEEHPGEFIERLDVFIAPFHGTENHAVQLATQLRRHGISTEVSSSTKLKRTLEMANKAGARFSLLVGSDEVAAQKYALRNMETGEQQTYTVDEIIHLLDGK